MHKKTLEDLAFYRIREEIAGNCASEEGKAELLRREPLTSGKKELMDELKKLGSQWQKAIQSKNPIRLQPWNEIASFLKALKAEGSTLEKDQLHSLMIFAKSALDIYSSIKTASKEIAMKNLADKTEKLPYSELQQTVNAISRILDNDGNLKDIPIIREIKQKIASINAEINSALKKYTSDPSMNQVLSSNVPAFKADRQVLAVKSSQRLKVPGIVHEVSGSGQTMFIEPEEVVRKNNELIQEEFHLAQETRKIFTELTAQIHPHFEQLKWALKIMTELDATYAAARWGAANRGIYALDTDEETAPELLQARHPLLGEKAVPIDIKFLKGKNILIITGPNTGGKTVTIKTFALFSMMNQAGFPLPAAEGTRLPVFDSIFADIGDEQSIDESLSTFSAHMKNIAAAVKHADEKSLVLLDELGSGTDPQEGGAIAMATLDALIEKKSFVLVTTHHGILKNYGYTNEFCVNASAEFDTDTLSPTYRLVMGVPGESHALDIAKRSGLPSATVNKAKSYMTNQQADVSTLIRGLTEKHAEVARLEKEFRQTEKELKDRIFRFEQKEIKMRQWENELKEREQRSESRFLRETRSQLENLVREIREGELTKEKTQKVRRFIDDLTEDVNLQYEDIELEKEKIEEDKKELEKRIEEDARKSNSIEYEIAENGMKIIKSSESKSKSTKKTKRRLSNREALATAQNTYSAEEVLAMSPKQKKQKADAPRVFEEGAEVLTRATKMRGTLVREEKSGVWLVQLGNLRMSFKEKDLMLLGQPNITAKPDYTVELSGGESGENAVFTKEDSSPKFELRLLGMYADDAIKALQRQLDLCVMQNFKNFSVIHGKGNGILQQAVQDFLSHYPGVKNFHFARPEDGGFGKTYVEMM